jgi:hypothetical protein
MFTFLSKTLTTLNLESNEIGAEGAEALADVFRESKVNIFLSLYLSLTSSLFTHRHSPHSISKEMVSGRKEPKHWLMLSEKTR